MSARGTPKPCCPGIELVLGRVRDNDRVGLQRQTMFSLTKQPGVTERLVIRMHKSRDRTAPHADSTFVLVNFCPFCGAKVKV
ncbi:MAG TPA: hypothetical protein VHM19_23145 [Polyangiales bacterium]|jgi:hypothetical protein|nr:hypothetical protein [Polyangiales bacterium]